MTRDKRYIPGTFYRICDMTGFKIRDFRTKKQWNNIIVRQESWEARQPQDFVRGVRDEQAAPEPRPRQTDTFLGPLTSSVLEAATTGSTTLRVNNTGRWYRGDTLNIILDNGNSFVTIITEVVDSNEVTLRDQLPWAVSSGKEVANWSAVSEANINSQGSGGDD